MRPNVNAPMENRATAIGNTHKTFGKDHTWGSGDILSDRQTDTPTHRHTQNNASQLLSQAK